MATAYPKILPYPNLLNSNGGGDGATSIEVTSTDNTVTQNGASSFNPTTKALTVDLSADKIPSYDEYADLPDPTTVELRSYAAVNQTTQTGGQIQTAGIYNILTVGGVEGQYWSFLGEYPDNITIKYGNEVLYVNTGTSANQILQLDGEAKVPAVDASQTTVGTVVPTNAIVSDNDSINTSVNKLQGQIDNALKPLSPAVNNNIVTTTSTGTLKDSGFNINNSLPYSNPLPTEIADALSTYNLIISVANGTNGLPPVSLYFDTNQTLSGLPTQGDYTCVDNDRVILTNQTNPAENLIYNVHSGEWTIAPDSAKVNKLLGAWTEIVKGTFSNSWTYLVSISPASGDVVPTSVTWSIPIPSGLYQAGAGLSLTGSVFSVADNGVTNTKLNTMPTNTIKANITGSTANPQDITIAQLNTSLSVNTNTQYVTPLGSDTNNGYTPSTGVATLGQALTNLGNVAGIIFISPKVGGYSGDYTITSQNINIVSLSPNQAVDFNGTLTFAHTASNVQLNNISCEILNHTGAGAVYMFGGSVTTSLTSSGNGYLYTSGVDLQATATTVSITGAKSVVFTNATVLGQLTINNPSAIVSLLNCLNSKAITLTSGVLGINNSTIYSASAGANAISVSPEAFFFATNSTFLVTNTTTPALINVDAGSIYSISNCAYSDSSVIAGTMLTRTGKFDAIALTTALPFASGGTGAKTRQAALNALASTVTTGQYLRGNGTNISMSAIQASDVPTLNQNTTGTASSVTGTNVVTNANLSTMPTNTLKGNNTGSTATPIDLTSTQVTAVLNNFVGDTGSGGTKGLTPAPGAGDGEAGKFLKADGTWAIPNGSGTSATYFRSYNIGATNGTAIQTITTTGTANWLTVTAAAQRLILNGNTLQNGGFTNSAVDVTIPTSGIYTITYTVTTTVIGLTNREIWVQLVKTTGGTPLAILASAELNGGSNNNGEITITYTGAFTVGDIIDLRMETIAGTPNVGINSYSLLINALAVPSAITETFTVGDTKTGLQSADHSNWLLWTNGRTLSRATYATLWNFVNTNSLVATGLFGAGDGATTFTLGNINGRAIGITGSGTGLTARTLGASVGTETQTLTTANLPSHNHNIIGDSGSGIGSGSTSDRVLLNTDGDVRNVFVKTTELTGSGTAHNNMQPTVFLNFFVFSG